jgi:ribosomal protein S18 acetylase RimI-like enzyme
MVKIYLASTTFYLEQISQLASTIWREHYIPIIGEPQVVYMLDKFQSVEAMLSQVEKGYEYFVIFFDNTPVGYCAINKEDDVLFLIKLYVLSHYRGNKIGKHVLDFINKKAETYGLLKLKLTVNKNNINSIKAYQKMGFIIVESIVIEIGNGFVMDDYVMERNV